MNHPHGVRRRGARHRLAAVGAIILAATAITSVSQSASAGRLTGVINTYTDIEYTEAVNTVNGNLLDLYVPETTGNMTLPLIIWSSGSAWFSDNGKAGAASIAAEFNARGYAVAGVSVRSSSQVRFPGQLHDIRAAVRWLRSNADQYGINPTRFAIMGNSSGGWVAAIAATTSDIYQVDGEPDPGGVSSAVQVAVPFHPPTDFLSMDDFAAEHDLPMGFAYPHDDPNSPESRLVECPGEVFPDTLLSIQDCPDETEAADPSSYIDGPEIPIWVLHGGQDNLLPYNQSQLVYETTTAAGNEGIYTFVPSAGHSVTQSLGADSATTWMTDRGGVETVTEGPGPDWDDIEAFISRVLDDPTANVRFLVRADLPGRSVAVVKSTCTDPMGPTTSEITLNGIPVESNERVVLIAGDSDRGVVNTDPVRKFRAPTFVLEITCTGPTGITSADVSRLTVAPAP